MVVKLFIVINTVMLVFNVLVTLVLLIWQMFERNLLQSVVLIALFSLSTFFLLSSLRPLIVSQFVLTTLAVTGVLWPAIWVTRLRAKPRDTSC